MTQRYLIDTSIWIDLYEDRIGFNGEPLGEYALKLISKLLTQKHIMVVSNILIVELEKYYSIGQIRGMLQPFKSIIEKAIATTTESREARIISIARNLPYGDALHAILARNRKAILITRDKHFRKLEDISEHFTPEDIL
ncbi:MAG: type II toxin-antitoxin system VapC family toxin [Candidatus Woesearchaeota archaeon]